MREVELRWYGSGVEDRSGVGKSQGAKHKRERERERERERREIRELTASVPK